METELQRPSDDYANILFLLASQTGSWNGHRKTHLYQRTLGQCKRLWGTGLGRGLTCLDQIQCGQVAEQQEAGVHS